MTDPKMKDEVARDTGAERQRISVIMANFNGEAHIVRAIRSVLEQTHHNLELIVSDDGSSDESCAIVRATMARDRRVRLIESENAACGPATARNRALNMATGDWVAIVDADDIIHPERLSRLLHCAVTLEADLVADDLIHFGEGASQSHKTLLQDLHLNQPIEIDATALVSGNLNGCRNIHLGYLKPLIRKAALGDLRYNEGLRIDEDHDLYLRMLLANARFALIPDAMYLYRRHVGSVSYRFDEQSLRKMIAAQHALLNTLPQTRETLRRAVGKRVKEHELQLKYIHLVEALKSRDGVSAMAQMMRNPRCAPLVLQSLIERGRRNRRKQAAMRECKKIVLCAQGHIRQADHPDYTIIHVPNAPGAGYTPSAARVWGELASLSDDHDLDILAYGRAGQYALGLVPCFRTAQLFSARGEKLTFPATGDYGANAEPYGICAEGA